MFQEHHGEIYIKASNTHYVKASNTNAGDQFGSALALTSDGNSIVVGAPEEASGATGIDGNRLDNSATASGAVYLFY